MLDLFPASFALAAAALLALALALSVWGRSAPGSRAFVWLMLAAAEWCTFSLCHWLAASYDAKFAFAQVQYIGIAAAAPLWLLFAADYAGSRWMRRRGVLAALWVIPALTVVVALTSRWHHALWTAVIVTGQGSAEYHHGWWFWLLFAYDYGVLATGTLSLLRGLRRSPPYRAQLIALLIAALFPWFANLGYITGLLPRGFDATPVAFAASGLLIAWALYRRGLFELVPVARDQLVDSLTDGVLVVDGARRVLDMNSAAQRLAADVVPWLGRRVDDLFPFLAGVSLAEEHREDVRAADGAAFELRASRVRGVEGAAAWIVVLHDVTEQRRTAEEREALVRHKTEFVSTVSHELRTPMFSIRGSLQLVLGSTKSALVAEDRKLLTIALSTTERLVRIVNDLLDLSAIEAQKLSLRRGVVSVDALIADALSDVTQVARQASVHLQSGVPLGPRMVLGDRDRLIQALVNLLSNAIKVSPADGVVTVDALQEGDLVCISVRDRGPGISQDGMHRLFERYEQLDAALSHRAGGTGLGLAITKALVEQHGGHIRVASTPGEGSTFTMCIPRAPDEVAESKAGSAPAPPLRPAPMIAPRSDQPHVLVADDEEDVREVLVEALQRRGFRVSTAADGEDALRVLRRAGVDVAVLDLHMPLISGYEVIRYARTEGPQPRLPIVVLTGAVDQLDSLELLGANTVLAKPTDIRRLLMEVESLLPERSPATRE